MILSEKRNDLVYFFCHLFVAIPAFAFPIQQLPLIVYNYASCDFGCVFVLLSKSPDWYFPNDGVVEIDKMSINKNSCRLATMLRTAKSHEPSMNKYLRLKKCQCEAMEKEHEIAWIINSPFWKLLCCLHIVRRSLSLWMEKHLSDRFDISMAINFLVWRILIESRALFASIWSNQSG